MQIKKILKMLLLMVLQKHYLHFQGVIQKEYRQLFRFFLLVKTGYVNGKKQKKREQQNKD